MGGSAFWAGRVSVDAFTWRVRIRMDLSSGGADGMTLLLHNDPRGILALGASGGALGYAGSASATGTFVSGVSITQGVGIRLDTYTNTQASTVGLITGGVIVNPGGEFVSPSDFSNGNPFDIVLQYSATSNNLTAVITEVRATGGNVTARYSWIVNIKSAVGCDPAVIGCFAYYGATAATGGSFQRHSLESSAFLSTWPSITPTASQTATSTASPSQTATSTASPSQTQVSAR